MNRTSQRTAQAIALLFFLLCAATPAAQAIAIFPADVQNNTPVTIEISVVRIQTQLGKPSTTNDTKVTIKPGQHASVMIMGGTFGTGASYTKQISIAQADIPGLPDAKALIYPLEIDKPSNTMVRQFVVEIDKKTSKFTFEPAPEKPSGAKNTNSLSDLR
jgi:hypothetical protein